jgi:hypothetical protein
MQRKEIPPLVPNKVRGNWNFDIPPGRRPPGYVPPPMGVRPGAATGPSPANPPYGRYFSPYNEVEGLGSGPRREIPPLRPNKIAGNWNR